MVEVECRGCAYSYLLHTGREGVEERGGEQRDGPPPPGCGPPPPELSDALRHVQRRQHLLEDGALHVGAAQVGLLQVAAGQVAVLQDR